MDTKEGGYTIITCHFLTKFLIHKVNQKPRKERSRGFITG